MGVAATVMIVVLISSNPDSVTNKLLTFQKDKTLNVNIGSNNSGVSNHTLSQLRSQIRDLTAHNLELVSQNLELSTFYKKSIDEQQAVRKQLNCEMWNLQAILSVVACAAIFCVWLYIQEQNTIIRVIEETKKELIAHRDQTYVLTKQFFTKRNRVADDNVLIAAMFAEKQTSFIVRTKENLSKRETQSEDIKTIAQKQLSALLYNTSIEVVNTSKLKLDEQIALQKVVAPRVIFKWACESHDRDLSETILLQFIQTLLGRKSKCEFNPNERSLSRVLIPFSPSRLHMSGREAADDFMCSARRSISAGRAGFDEHQRVSNISPNDNSNDNKGISIYCSNRYDCRSILYNNAL
jgi:hypothetical protein